MYALDTNVIIELLKNNPKVKLCLDMNVRGSIMLVIPPLVHYEIHRGFLYRKSPIKEIVGLQLEDWS